MIYNEQLDLFDFHFSIQSRFEISKRKTCKTMVANYSPNNKKVKNEVTGKIVESVDKYFIK